MKPVIYDHFHPDEHYFVDRAAEWIERAVQRHERKRTDFLDPRQAYILTVLANSHPDAVYRLEGGYEDAERCRALIAPAYADLQEEPAGIEVLSIMSRDPRFAGLEHGDYLGALLGLGIKRDKIGDIQLLEDQVHCLIAEEIMPYISGSLQKVHRVEVETSVLPLDQLLVAKPRLEPQSFTVASMRLDGIAGDVFRLSRSKVLLPIQAGRCRVNWKVEEDPSRSLKDGDMVSMQGFGRFRVLETEGVTKKGRIRVTVGKYV